MNLFHDYTRFDNNDIFMDFFNSIWDSCHGPYATLHVIYPPLTVLFFAALGGLTIPFIQLGTAVGGSSAEMLRDSQLGMMVFFVVVMACLVMIRYMLDRKNDGNRSTAILIILLVFFSAPILSAVERGNIILL